MMNLINVLDYTPVTECSGVGLSEFPGQIAYIISLAINLIKIVIPIMLIVWGMLDLGKAVMAQKEDEIKKGQQTFVKRIVAAAIIFFIITIVQLIVNLISDDNNLWDCINAIINYKK